MTGARAAGAHTVRRADTSDTAFVLSLAPRFGETRADWRSSDEVIDGTRRQLARAFEVPRAEDAIFIAVDAAGERAGFVYVVTQRDFFTGEAHGHVSEIAARSAGNGVGSLLMQAAETWARERGFRYLSLNVNDTNAAARSFYEKRTYVPEYRHLVKLLE